MLTIEINLPYGYRHRKAPAFMYRRQSQEKYSLKDVRNRRDGFLEWLVSFTNQSTVYDLTACGFG